MAVTTPDRTRSVGCSGASVVNVWAPVTPSQTRIPIATGASITVSTVSPCSAGSVSPRRFFDRP